MGGKSSSSTASTQQTQNQQQIATTTVGLEDSAGAIAGGRDVSVTQISTDQGAVKAAFGLGDAALSVGRDVTTHAIDASSYQLDRSLDFGSEVIHAQADTSAKTASTLAGAIDKAAAATRSDTSQGLTQIAKYGAVAVVLIFGAMFFFRTRRSA